MITVYTIAFNEEFMIKFMIDHYRKRFPNCNIVVYDNHSTDNTVDIAKANKCEVIPFDTENQINDRIYIEIKNNCWKKSKTDWVLVCDVDELLDISQTELDRERRLWGSTIIKTTGFDMVNLEKGISLPQIKHGVRNIAYDKSCLFNTRFIKEINYKAGCHICNPEGIIKYSTKHYQLFHYRYLNADLLVKRYKTFFARLSDENKENDWGIQYLQTEEEIRTSFEEQRKKANRILP